MLDSKKECKFPVVIIVFLGILLFSFPILIIVLIVILFNSLENIEKILKTDGIKECEIAKKILKLLREHKNNKSEKNYYELILEKSEKDTKNHELKKIKELKYEAEKRHEELKNVPSQITKKRNLKKNFTKKTKINKSKLKERQYSFNGGKSIWDDYESIADKINNKY